MTQKSRADLDTEVTTQLESLYHALLSASASNTFDLKRFFPTGRKSDIGQNITAWKASLQRCLEGLAQYSTIPSASAWKQTLEALQKQYNPKIDEVSTLDSQKRGATVSQTKLRSIWKRSYLYCKRIMEGLLLRAGREGEYRGMFLDLQTPAKAAKTQAPADEDSSGSSSGTVPASSADGASAQPQ